MKEFNMKELKKLLSDAVESLAETIVRDCYIDYSRTHNIDSTSEKKFLFDLNMQGKSNVKYEEVYFDIIDKTKTCLVNGMPELMKEYPEIAAHSSTVKAIEMYSELINEIKKNFDEIVSQLASSIMGLPVEEHTCCLLIADAKQSCESLLDCDDVLKKAEYMLSNTKYSEDWYQITTDFTDYVKEQEQAGKSLPTTVASIIQTNAITMFDIAENLYKELYLKDLTTVVTQKLPLDVLLKIQNIYETVRVFDRKYYDLILEKAPSVVNIKIRAKYTFQTREYLKKNPKGFKWTAENISRAKRVFARTQFTLIENAYVRDDCKTPPEILLPKYFKDLLNVDIENVYNLLLRFDFYSNAKKLFPIAVIREGHINNPDMDKYLLENYIHDKDLYNITLFLYTVILITSEDTKGFIDTI